MTRRSIAALAVLAATGLTACGASAPPAKELAVEAIDSLVADGYIVESEAECMREKVAAYEGDALDDIANNAAENNSAEAFAELDQFQADLADCRAAG